MSFEPSVLLLACRRLEEANISYKLTDSFAANFYSVPRMTRDADIVIQIHKPAIKKNIELNYIDRWVEKLKLLDVYNKVQTHE